MVLTPPFYIGLPLSGPDGTMPFVTTPDSRQRFWIRATLVAGMVLLSICLYAVIRSSPLVGSGSSSGAALSSTTGPRVHVLGPDDRPVARAQVSVLTNTGKPAPGVSWDSDAGILKLPEAGRDYAVRVTARGYRVLELPAVRAGQTIHLRRGYVARILLRGPAEDELPEGVGVLLRIRPVEVSGTDMDAQAVVNQMDNLGGPGSGPRSLPRKMFGYPVSREQARAGVVLPAPGTYEVHWGLMDIRKRTWVTLNAGCGRRMVIEPRETPLRVALEMTSELVQNTIEELARRVKGR